MRLGKVIRRWRLAEDLTLKEAAELMDIAPSILHRMEHGKSVHDNSLASVLSWLMSKENPMANSSSPKDGVNK